jgi:hypothetical protein
MTLLERRLRNTTAAQLAIVDSSLRHKNSSLSKKFSQAGLDLIGKLRVIDAVRDFKRMTVDPLSLARVACGAETWK